MMGASILDLAYEHVRVKEVNHSLTEIEIVTHNNLKTSDFLKYITDRKVEINSLNGNRISMPRGDFYRMINSQLKEHRVPFLDFKQDFEVSEVYDDYIIYTYMDDNVEAAEYRLDKESIIGSKVLPNGDLSILDRANGYKTFFKDGSHAKEICETMTDDSKLIAYLKKELEEKEREITDLNTEIGQLVLKVKDLEENPVIYDMGSNQDVPEVLEKEIVKEVVVRDPETEKRMVALKEACMILATNKKVDGIKQAFAILVDNM